MSGTQKPHFAVDLNEIERQLAQAQSAPPSHASSGGRHDPLADLARIGGQDDPFEALLAGERTRGHASQPERREPLFAARGPAVGDPYAQRSARQPVDFQDNLHDEEPQAPAYGYQQPVAAAPAEYDQHGYSQDGYAQDYYDGNNDPHAGQYDEAAYQPPRSRSRKGVLALGAILGVVALGSAGAFMFSGGSAAITGGEPPLIAASNEPIKVAPQNPGGVEIPNQNKQIYERAQSGTTKVVSNSEQPVDVKQTVRMNGGSVADATGSAGPAPQAGGGLNLGEPRKVRTISIKPDGTLARPEPEAKVAAVAAPPAMTMPAASPPAPAAAPHLPPAPQLLLRRACRRDPRFRHSRREARACGRHRNPGSARRRWPRSSRPRPRPPHPRRPLSAASRSSSACAARKRTRRRPSVSSRRNTRNSPASRR